MALARYAARAAGSIPRPDGDVFAEYTGKAMDLLLRRWGSDMTRILSGELNPKDLVGDITTKAGATTARLLLMAISLHGAQGAHGSQGVGYLSPLGQAVVKLELDEAKTSGVQIVPTLIQKTKEFANQHMRRDGATPRRGDAS